MKASFLEKLLQRVDHLGQEELQTYLLRMAREIGFLETIFNSLQEAIVVLDSEGRIDYTNRAAQRILPLPDDIPPGTLISKYLRDVDWPLLLASGQTSRRLLEIHYPESRSLEFYLLPMQEREGSDNAFVALFRDVTKQHTDTREAIESERLQALTLLAAGVAHELGNPINSLNIHLQLMERDLRKFPEVQASGLRESIRVARDEMDRLDGIISRFLKAVRPTLPDFREMPVAPLLEEIVASLKAEIQDRNLLVEVEVEKNLPLLRLDTEQIKQAFYNIIKNAVQAMREKGILRIKVELREGSVLVTFKDNGSGISLEDIPRVLEAYYTTKQRGTGLGLMIVQRIVQEHGAELQIESFPGQGTTVRIRFPLGQQQVRLLEG
jgi:two-component system, sporulation sensor kinase E